MPIFGVIVTFIIIYYAPGEDSPSARWEQAMSPARCLAAMTQGLLAEAERHGSIANGGSMIFACQVDLPPTKGS